jgi:hypothetical protein
MRRRPFIHVLMAVFLLINGTATAAAAATHVATASQQDISAMPEGAHSHCGGAGAMDEMGNVPAAESGDGSGQHHHGSNSCCSAGACHCASASASTALRVLEFTVPASISVPISSQFNAAPLPEPARHFRPPIR